MSAVFSRHATTKQIYNEARARFGDIMHGSLIDKIMFPIRGFLFYNAWTDVRSDGDCFQPSAAVFSMIELADFMREFHE